MKTISDIRMNSDVSSNKLGRVPTLDALRGIASVGVAWYHFTHQASVYAPKSLIILSGSQGWLGVPVFFVISGFVIPYALYRANYAVSDYGKFLLKRITRLDPPYLISIGFILLHAYLLTLRSSYVGEPYRFPTTQVLLHLGYLNVFFGYEWLNGVFWSLAVEFQYYLAIGLLFPVMLGGKGQVRNLAIAALLASSLILRSSPFIFSFWGLFLLGIVTLQRHLNQIGYRTHLSLTLLIATSCVASTGWLLAIIGLATSLVIAYVRLDFKVLRFFGRISYSLYLLHGPVGLPIFGFLIGRVHNVNVALAITSILTAGVAYAFYLAVERPSQRLSSKLTYKRATFASFDPAPQPAQGFAV